ncbi:MAG TPA: DUF6635 family protein [Nitrospiraceae bacterium]|nr:DUF6635 family protein [Nitrospiraceae bacterium]
MSNQQTATAILAFEECIEQYIAECRGRVDGFVERHFSLQETIALQKQSLVSDLLCHPINALWSIPSIFVKKLIEVPMKLGWRSGADLMTLVPTGFKTCYQREIEQLIATELLDWPCTMGDRRASPNGLLERIKQHKQVGPLLASGALSDEALRELSDIPRLIAEHSAGRALVLDTTATVLTLATGWLFFGDYSLGISGIGDQIAGKRARDNAASTFMLGASLGSAFYSVFPPKPSFWQVVGATLTVGLFITAMSLLVGMMSDPCLKRVGFQHTRLNVLIDAVEDCLHRQIRKHLKPVIRQLAA